MVRTIHEAIRTVETYSPAEERFNRRRRTAGLFLAPVVFLTILAVPMSGLDAPAHELAAIFALMMVLWVSEALPLPVTALIGPLAAIALGIAPARAALAPFADPVIFLFIGSFMLAEAMFVHGVDRRIAYAALSSRLVGTSAVRILGAYGTVAMLLSMWISNTATTAMLFPIGLSILMHFSRDSGSRQAATPRFAIAMMLMTSFAASVGGIGTPVGTPPNLIGLGMLERLTGTRVSFVQWMTLGVPIALALFGFLLVYFWATCARGVAVAEGGAELVREELRKLGPMTRGQRNVLAAFGVTVLLWIAPGLFTIAGADQSAFARAYASAMPEGVAAMMGALLLFVLPLDWKARRFTLTWEEAVRIDWGIVLLFGGGIAMGELAFSTGLAEAIGRGLTSRLPAHDTATLTILFTGAAIVISEGTSNTASATMIVPIAIAVAQASGVRPIEPALGATLGASMGFMMPISTPPNAIVYSSGYVPITSMMKFGIVLDLVGFVVIVGFVLAIGRLF
ncbi:MAG: DASS family sodium-coupled anion symporter [Acidobacteria bacterium]|nr:DASS family sodium-coupled anion symporter [Acidobacteriota bacterium]